MKNVILTIGLVLSLNGFSQLGGTRSDVFKSIREDNNLLGPVEEVTLESGGYYLVAQNKGDVVLSVIYYFQKGIDVCYMKRIACVIEALNTTVKDFNRDFVKVSDLKWKDYTDNTVIDIRVYKNHFFIDMKYDN